MAASLQRMLEDAQTLMELIREGEDVGDDLVRAARRSRPSAMRA